MLDTKSGYSNLDTIEKADAKKRQRKRILALVCQNSVFFFASAFSIVSKLSICHIKRVYQVIIMNIRNRYSTMQYNVILRLKAYIKRKTSLITVARIALKGQADLILIMVPLEVLV